MQRSDELSSTAGIGAVMFLFIVGSSLTVPLASITGHDSWISILLSISLSSFLVWMYAATLQLYPGLTLIEIGSELFGVWIGRLIALLYTWYSFHLGALVLRNFTEFIKMVALPQTPPLIISAMMIGIVLWASHYGIEVICRCAIVIVTFVIIDVFFSTSLMMKELQFVNLLPILDKGWLPIMKGSTELIGFPFGETILFMMILPQLNQLKKVRQTMIGTLILAGLFLLMINLRNTMILGELSSRLIYPSYTASQYISIADFIERIEPIDIITWVLGGFIKICICLSACIISLSTAVSSNKQKSFFMPLSILMLELSILIYKNNVEMIKFASNLWQWYSVPFQIVIPCIIFIAAWVNKRKLRKKLLKLTAGAE